MIDERTLSNWLNVLEEAGHYLEEGETPPPEWLTRLDWLIWDGRRDIEARRFDVPGFVPQAVVDRLNNEIRSYEADAYRLDEECAKLESEIAGLETENYELKKELEEKNGLSDRNS